MKLLDDSCIDSHKTSINIVHANLIVNKINVFDLVILSRLYDILQTNY